MKRIGVFIILLLLVLATSWALFHPDLFRVHDYVHGARIAEMYRALAEGQFPVRWSENFGFGYGMPLFLFYAPLPYLAGSVLYWLSFDLVLSVKSLFFWANLGAVVGAYLLGKELSGRQTGLVVAAAYALAPYRAVNLYVRGAISEAWGMMALPWILYFGLRLVHARQLKPVDVAGFVLSLLVLILSHNLTTLMFVPISGLFLVAYAAIKWGWAWRRWLWLVALYLLAAGLGLFYMLPAVLEKDFTQISSIFSGYFHYGIHFLYLRQFFDPTWGYGGSEWGPNDGISFFLGFGQWASLVILGLGLVWTAVQAVSRRSLWAFITKQQHLITGVLFACLSVSLFMSLARSQPLWDGMPFLEFIQFPWRWLSVSILFIALLSGWALTYLPPRWRVVYTGSMLLAMFFNAWYFRPESFLDDAEALYYADEQKIREEMSMILPDYIPKAVIYGTKEARDNVPPRLPDQWLQIDQTPSDELVLLVDEGHQKLIQTNFAEPTSVTMAIAYFPGWRVETKEAVVETTIDRQGLLTFEAPAGPQQISIYFSRTPVRQVADVASGLSLFLFGSLLLLSTRRKISL